MKFCQLLGVRFHPEQVLGNLKYQCLLKFKFEMAGLICFLVIRINQIECILSPHYILTDRFLNRRGYLADMIVCHLLNVKFPFTHVLRNVAVFIQIWHSSIATYNN